MYKKIFIAVLSLGITIGAFYSWGFIEHEFRIFILSITDAEAAQRQRDLDLMLQKPPSEIIVWEGETRVNRIRTEVVYFLRFNDYIELYFGEGRSTFELAHYMNNHWIAVPMIPYDERPDVISLGTILGDFSSSYHNGMLWQTSFHFYPIFGVLPIGRYMYISRYVVSLEPDTNAEYVFIEFEI